MTHIVSYAFPVRRMLCGMGLHVNDPSDQYVKNVSFREKTKQKQKQIWPARNLPGLIGADTLHQYYSASSPWTKWQTFWQTTFQTNYLQ